jgi:hypothetical protein
MYSSFCAVDVTFLVTPRADFTLQQNMSLTANNSVFCTVLVLKCMYLVCWNSDLCVYNFEIKKKSDIFT